jgi:hypothetical protein
MQPVPALQKLPTGHERADRSACFVMLQLADDWLPANNVACLRELWLQQPEATSRAWAGLGGLGWCCRLAADWLPAGSRRVHTSWCSTQPATPPEDMQALACVDAHNCQQRADGFRQTLGQEVSIWGSTDSDDPDAGTDDHQCLDLSATLERPVP